MGRRAASFNYLIFKLLFVYLAINVELDPCGLNLTQPYNPLTSNTFHHPGGFFEGL
jgi:hypothetical protein